MARQPRVEYPGALHHVMSRGNDGIAIFRDDTDRELFVDLLSQEVGRSGWILHDYCLMTTHYHLAIETPACTLSTGLQRLLGRYSQRFNKRHGRRGHLFQERFKNVLVEKELYALELSRYIALNPVRAGIVACPEDWPWSSYRARAGLAACPGWLTVEPILKCFGDEAPIQHRAWRNYVLGKIGETRELLDLAVSRIYLGTTSWVAGVQALLDQSEKSDEFVRDQVHPGRPTIDDVIDAVAATFNATPEGIAQGRGTLVRRLVAWFAFEEGLVPLRRIATSLGLRSAGGVSRLVSRCRAEMACDAELRAIIVACRSRMRRRPPPFLATRGTPLATARHYHRAAGKPRR